MPGRAATGLLVDVAEADPLPIALVVPTGRKQEDIPRRGRSWGRQEASLPSIAALGTGPVLREILDQDTILRRVAVVVLHRAMLEEGSHSRMGLFPTVLGVSPILLV
jgi:hypothetical protein